MTPIRHLLCATDFSDDARLATRRAAALAALHRARLSLIHIVNESSLRALRSLLGQAAMETGVIDDARAALEREAGEVRTEHPGLVVETCVRTGQPTDAILAAARDADLLVLGAHGQNPLRDMLIGTTAERLLRHVERPVLVCRSDGASAYRRVMVAVDLSDASADTLRAATALATGATVCAVHALELPFEGKLWLAGVSETEVDRLRMQARARALRAILDITTAFGEQAAQRIEVRVEQGAAARVIIEQARELGAELVVMARHGRSAAERLFIGSVTRHVLSNAPCDVLVTQT